MQKPDDEQGNIFSRFITGLNKNWGAITQIIGAITGLTLTVRRCVEAFAEMDQEMNSVRKYTGQNIDEVKALNEEFKRMDTRTPREQLNQLAGSAGRLGIQGTEARKDFVYAADQINLALGDDLGKGAVDQIGKLTMAFGEDDRLGLRDAMLSTGSAVNELAQNSAANAGYLVDFTARLSGVGVQAGLTQAQILGIGAAMDENMQKDEMAATAISQIITKMTTDSETFARIAGKNVEDFSRLVKEDMNTALLQFFESMNKKGGFTELAPLFEQMGLDGTRAIGVLSTLASKIADVQRHQQLATKAYEEHKSVEEEASIQNKTYQAELEKARKRFNDLKVELGERLLPVVTKTITGGGMLVKVLSIVAEFVLKCRTTIMTLTVAIVAWNAATIVSITWNSILKPVLEAATLAVKNLYKAIAANPWGAAVAGIALVVSILYDLSRASNEASAAQRQLKDAETEAKKQAVDEAAEMDQLMRQINLTNESTEKRKELLEKINGKLMQEHLGNLTEEDIRTGKATETLNEYNKALQQRIRKEILMQRLTEAMKKKEDAENGKVEWNNADWIEQFLFGSQSSVKYSLDENGKLVEEISDRSARIKERVIQEQNEIIEAIQRELDDDYFTNYIWEELEKRNPNKESDGSNGKVSYDNRSFWEQELKDRRAKLKALREDANAAAADIEETAREVKEAEEKMELFTGSKAGDKQEREEDRLRRERERKANDAAKAETEQQLAELTHRYATGQILYCDYIDEQERIQLEGIERRMLIYRTESLEYQKLNRKREELLLNGSEESRKLTLAQMKQGHEQRLAAIEEQAWRENMTEQQKNEMIFFEDMRFMDEQRILYRRGTLERINLEREIEERDHQHRLQRQQYYQQQLEQAREQLMGIGNERQKELALKGLQEMYDALKSSGVIQEQEYQEMVLAVKAQYANYQTQSEHDQQVGANALKVAQSDAKQKIDNSDSSSVNLPIVGDIMLYQSTMEQLKQMYQNDEMTHAQYLAAKQQATAQFCESLASQMQAAYNAVNQVMSAASSYFSAQQEYETSLVQKKYEKQIAAAGNNQKKVKKLQEQQQKEEAAIKSKYAKRAAAIQMAQAVAQTAISAINAYSSAAAIPVVGTVLAPIAAAMAIAAGALQIATIKKQQQAQEAGYYEGGFTGGRRYRKEAGVVHEGEFVANHKAVENPAIMPFLNFLDQAQRNNTVGSLTSADVSRSVGSTQVVTPIVNVQNNNDELRDTVEASREATEMLVQKLDDGIESYMVVDDLDVEFLYRKLKRHERLINKK